MTPQHARAAALVLGLSALCAGPAADAASRPSAEARADALVRQALRDGPYPGVSVAVQRHGRVIYEKGFGASDLAKGTPVRPDTQFPIGSITKSFTCLAVQQQVALGRLDLDQTVGHYLPEVPAPAREVAIRHLLDHTSGIPNYTELPDFPHAHPVGLSRSQMLGFFAARPLLFAPGERFNYSNSDTYLLGLLVERTSGQAYDAYVKAHILEPFGMTRTNLEAHDDGSEGRARGYRLGAHGFEPSTVYDYDVPFSAGVIVSTAPDLLRYRNGVFGPGADRRLAALVLAQDHFADGQANPYMLGCLIRGNLDGHAKITHSGDIYGFAAHYAYYPDDDLTVAVLTNHQGAAFPPLTLEHKLARVFLGLPEPRRADLPTPADLGRAIEGDYAIGRFRFGFDRVGFAYREGKLSLSLGGNGAGGPVIPLRFQGGGRFVSAIDDEQVFDFKTGPGGAADLTIHYYEGDLPARLLPPVP